MEYTFYDYISTSTLHKLHPPPPVYFIFRAFLIFSFSHFYFELRIRAPPNLANEDHSGLKVISSKDKDNVVGCKNIVDSICQF